MKEIKERIFSKLENDYFRRSGFNMWLCVSVYGEGKFGRINRICERCISTINFKRWKITS
jgi:hypothetical protein